MERVIAQGDLRPMAGSRSAMRDLEAILDAREEQYGLADLQINTSEQDFDSTLDLLEKEAKKLIT
jgi:XRE family aerobic/anaerobic benzoate catabolism transcriptional regulator